MQKNCQEKKQKIIHLMNRRKNPSVLHVSLVQHKGHRLCGVL